MGFYINPTDKSKEQFLREHGIPTNRSTVEDWDFKDKTKYPVVWVNNGLFTAAGIAFCPNETKAFCHPCGRDKRYFIVNTEDLFPTCPDFKTYWESLTENMPG